MGSLHAQAQTSSSGATAAQKQQGEAPAQRVTVVGCIQSEQDYRRAKDAGRGGALGTGVGAGNEFVLIDASMSTGAAATAGTAGAKAEAPGATGTGGAAPSSAAYELTGANEAQAGQHVGHRVEISGMLKAADVAGGRPTGGATAGNPPEGIDIGGEDLKLRELEVSSIRQTAGSCPSM
jgi:hypothetical protein